MTTSAQAATAALRYLAEEQCCSVFEVQGIVELWGGDAALAAELLAAWTDRGWVELLPADDAGDSLLVALTDRGYAESGLPPSAS